MMGMGIKRMVKFLKDRGHYSIKEEWTEDYTDITAIMRKNGDSHKQQ